MRIFRTLDAINIMFTTPIVDTDLGKFSIVLNGCWLETDDYKMLISTLSGSIKVYYLHDHTYSFNGEYSDIIPEIIRDAPEIIYPILRLPKIIDYYCNVETNGK